MKKVVLQFKSILDLTDFVAVIGKHDHVIDHVHLTICGYFEEADIELARAGYNAVASEFRE